MYVNTGNTSFDLSKKISYLLYQSVPDPDLKRSETEEIAGLVNWNRPHKRAYGLSTTLYERHPITSERAGEYVIITRFTFQL